MQLPPLALQSRLNKGSFQRRQEDLIKSKTFWRNALAAAVTISVIASATLIYELHGAVKLEPVFFLKLSLRPSAPKAGRLFSVRSSFWILRGYRA